MFILKRNSNESPGEFCNYIQVQEVDIFDVCYLDKLGQLDRQISLLLNMDLFDYRNIALESLNLKKDSYVTDAKNIHTLLYANTLDEAFRWREWVESKLLMSVILKEDYK